MASNKKLRNSFTRIELYDLVWSKPISEILEDYAISRMGFKDLCKTNDVPLPPNGYWSKVRYNIKVEVRELPNPLDNYEILVNEDSNENSSSPQANFIQLKKQLLKDSSLIFTVSNRLVNPDPLITSAKKGIEEFLKNKYYLGDRIVSTLENQISICVSKENVLRALRFMDALVKLVKKRGHTIEVNRTTRVIINEQEIQLRFREIMKREQHPEYSWITKMPSGILSFRIDTRNGKEWRDSKNNPLETRLADILAKLELVGKEMEAYQIELERGWEQQRIKRNIEQAAKMKREKEISDFKSLVNSSGRWHKSQNLRNFLDAFETKAKENRTLDKEKVEWIEWARKKADWYDPFVESDDELFEGIDRDSI